jgi:hypothetical protein
MKRKNPEQLKQELAVREATRCAESENRREKINRLLDLKEPDLKEQDLKAKTYKERVKIYEERKLKIAIAKERRLKRLQNCFKLLAPVRELEDIVNDLREKADLKYHGLLPWQEICELVDWLTELACLQDREIEYLMQFRRDWEQIRRSNPEKLQDLSRASLMSLVLESLPYLENQHAGLTPSQRWERYQRRSEDGEVDSIEYQFGGAGEAAWRKSSLADQPYQPTCLLKVLMGVPFHMRHLLDLFYPLGRDRLSKYVQSYSYENGREVLYRPPVVPMTMKALLSEGDEPAKRKRAQGKAKRIWLTDPDDPNLRIRVLRAIEVHIKGLHRELLEAGPPDRAQEWGQEWQEWQPEIANVLHPYLSDSAD